MAARIALSIAAVTLHVFHFITSENIECTSELDMLRCYNVIPEKVPQGVTKVYFTLNLHSLTFEASMFMDNSWAAVSGLDITAEYSYKNDDISIAFSSGCFDPLSKLIQLRLHGNKITLFSVEVFKKNTNLKLLEFSSCPAMQCNDFVNTMLRVKITIETLILSNIGDWSGKYCIFDNKFVEALARAEVLNLSVRRSTIVVHGTLNILERPRTLKVIDISETAISLRSADLHHLYRVSEQFADGLTTFNLSKINLLRYAPTANEFNDVFFSRCDQIKHTILPFFLQKAKNVYANEIFGLELSDIRKVTVNNVFLNLSECVTSLQTLQFRHNRLRYLNMTIYLPEHNNLTTADFSFNEIIYMSPYVFKSAKSLEDLILKHNALEYFPEFNDLLSTLSKLKFFSVAKNGLSNLPFDFFRGNLNLQILDLSENIFTSITFSLKHLKHLQLLNLSFNHIHFLEGEGFELVKFYLSRNDSDLNTLEMTGNPLECSCASVQFVKWMLSNVQSNSKYTCKLDGENSEISEYSLKYSEYLCYRTVLFVGIAVLVITVILVLGVVIKYVRRQKRIRKQKCSREHFLREFRQGNLPEKYMCQISYTSKDEMLVVNGVYPNLKDIFSQVLEVQHDIICIGDTHFSLGRPIFDEILRCISESCVMIYVISNPFCESKWCEIELREAYEANKPIILLFKENVKEEKMSPVLLKIFNRFTRAKLVVNNGKSEIIPSWAVLGESIINLASNNYIAGRKLRKRQTRDQDEDDVQV